MIKFWIADLAEFEVAHDAKNKLANFSLAGCNPCTSILLSHKDIRALGLNKTFAKFSW